MQIVARSKYGVSLEVWLIILYQSMVDFSSDPVVDYFSCICQSLVDISVQVWLISMSKYC